MTARHEVVLWPWHLGHNFLGIIDLWRMELPKELKGELLTDDFALVNVDDFVWPPLPA